MHKSGPIFIRYIVVWSYRGLKIGVEKSELLYWFVKIEVWTGICYIWVLLYNRLSHHSMYTVCAVGAERMQTRMGWGSRTRW